MAGIGLGMLTIDKEFGAEVYCGATTENQAWQVFKPARLICLRLAGLRERFGIEVNAKTLVLQDNSSRFEPVIGNPGDGASPSCGIVDEYHEHKTSDLSDTLVTGMGARQQPLMLYITTAGSDFGGPCYTKRDDVKKILSGAVEDDRIFGIIYTIDKDDAWDTIEAQQKANPNYDVSISADYLEGQLQQARRSPSIQAAYKTKHLNLWVGAKAAWMNMLAFQACRKKNLDIEDFKGEPCFIGIDLASRKDVAAMAILFPPGQHCKKFTAFFRHYLPEDTILNGTNHRYKGWHASGHLIATSGGRIDFAYLEDELRLLRSNFEIQEVPFDPYQANQFSMRMTEERFPMIEFGPVVKNFSEPMKELEALIIAKEIQFQMDPVFMWMIGNVVAKLDKKDNIFPDKEREGNKIDGVVALIMALGRAMNKIKKESVYKRRGMLKV